MSPPETCSLKRIYERQEAHTHWETHGPAALAKINAAIETHPRFGVGIWLTYVAQEPINQPGFQVPTLEQIRTGRDHPIEHILRVTDKLKVLPFPGTLLLYAQLNQARRLADMLDITTSIEPAIVLCDPDLVFTTHSGVEVNLTDTLFHDYIIEEGFAEAKLELRNSNAIWDAFIVGQ